jgi:hypothetical protein
MSTMLTVHPFALLSCLALGTAISPLPTTEPIADAAAPEASAVGGENQYPVCVIVPLSTIECQGNTTVVTLDGSGSYDPDGDPITFDWGSCPGSVLSNPSSPVTQLTLDTSLVCNLTCGVRLRVQDNHGAFSLCRVFVNVVEGFHGCTPGYWKNHTESWGPTGFFPTDDFDTVFGVNAFTPDKTLLQALQQGGGGIKKMGRMATAALLSASHAGVNFPRSQSDVIDQVHDAIVTGHLEPLASELDEELNQNCPLN